MRRPDQPLPQEQHRRGTAGHEVRIVAVELEQRERLLQRAWLVVVEAHDATPAARWIARTIP